MDDLNRELLEELVRGNFEFVDLGCGTGESIGFCERKFKRRPGIGFDISERKIEGARANGQTAVLADVTQTEFPKGCVSFCTMMDFLEHLFSLDAAITMLERSGRLARDFLFIRHPSFEDIEYLASCGLKLDWTDWRGHRNMMRLDDFHSVFKSLGWEQYVIIPQKQIFDSSHPAVVPIDAPCDTVRYNPESHGPKSSLYFTRPVWTQFDIFVRLNSSMEEKVWREVILSSSVMQQLDEIKELYYERKERLTNAESAFAKEKERRIRAEDVKEKVKAKLLELEEILLSERDASTSETQQDGS